MTIFSITAQGHVITSLMFALLSMAISMPYYIIVKSSDAFRSDKNLVVN